METIHQFSLFVRFITKLIYKSFITICNKSDVLFIGDPILFPSFIHTQKRNPQTHLKDADMFWDFIRLRPETTHQVMFLFADRGIPNGYRYMNG